ncbi:MAG: single-stranded DNA-binding protein [Oscillospiraceae bacterium]|nr:single-stranded DNA-binding protein [Oscillospiraceae bacterium]
MREMELGWNENHIVLAGLAEGTPERSHVNHGVTYLRFPLHVSRLSGAEDVVNVVLSQEQLYRRPVAPGQCLRVEGEVRSYNNRSGFGSKLVITVYARQLGAWAGEHVNELALEGALCKPPVLRQTPLGREICDLLLAVNRKYSRADYLPCIAWGGLAQWCARLRVGDRVRLKGRLQSRVYTKQTGGEPERRTAYEVSIMSLEPLHEVE